MNTVEKRLSVKQYADSVGLTRQAILSRIKKGLELKGVKSFEKIGKAYIITLKNEEAE